MAKDAPEIASGKAAKSDAPAVPRTVSSAYHHGDLRRALLSAADEILSEDGLRALTLRACARRAGVSHTAPKHHFGDLRGLLTAVAQLGFERLLEAVRGRMAPVMGDLDEELYAVTSAYVGFAQAYREHFRVMFRADLLEMTAEELPLSIRTTFLELTNVILRQRGEANLKGVADMIAPPDALLDDILIGWCSIHGYAHLRIAGQLEIVSAEAEEAYLRRLSRRVARAIRSPSS